MIKRTHPELSTFSKSNKRGIRVRTARRHTLRSDLNNIRDSHVWHSKWWHWILVSRGHACITQGSINIDRLPGPREITTEYVNIFMKQKMELILESRRCMTQELRPRTTRPAFHVPTTHPSSNSAFLIAGLRTATLLVEWLPFPVIILSGWPVLRCDLIEYTWHAERTWGTFEI